MSELGICFTGKRDRLVFLFSCCIDCQGVSQTYRLAVNDMGGLLDIEILRNAIMPTRYGNVQEP